MISLESLSKLMQAVAAQREVRCALVVDFASRLTRQPDHPGRQAGQGQQ